MDLTSFSSLQMELSTFFSIVTVEKAYSWKKSSQFWFVFVIFG